MNATVFIITADAIADVSGEMIDSDYVVAVTSSLKDANEFIDNIEETYMRKRYDYTITEMKIT